MQRIISFPPSLFGNLRVLTLWGTNSISLLLEAFGVHGRCVCRHRPVVPPEITAFESGTGHGSTAWVHLLAIIIIVSNGRVLQLYAYVTLVLTHELSVAF